MFKQLSQALAPRVTRKAVLVAIAIPEGIIMLTIAVVLDVAGLVCFILDFVYGIGIPISFVLDFVGAPVISSWAAMRPFYRAAIGKIAAKAGKIGAKAGSYVMEKTASVGGGQEGSQQSPLAQTGSKAAKAADLGLTGANIGFKGVKIGLSAIRFIISLIIELIPFLGDIMPTWTFFVLYELAESEMEI